MRRLLPVLALSVSLSAPAAAQMIGIADPTAFSMSEAGGVSAVYQAATACTAAMRYEADASGKTEAREAAERISRLAYETGGALGMRDDAIKTQIDRLVAEYKAFAPTDEARHKRMVRQCRLLAGAQ